jgi:hypothetical protein
MIEATQDPMAVRDRAGYGEPLPTPMASRIFSLLRL